MVNRRNLNLKRNKKELEIVNEIQEATPWEIANCDLSCSAPGHAQRCTCSECMKIYEQRKATRDREIREIEAQIGEDPFSPRIIAILITIACMLSFLAGVMLDKKLDIF